MARFLISWQARRTLTHKCRHTKTLLTPHILYVACMCSSWERAGWPLRRTKGCFVRWRCSANQRSLPCSMKSSWKLHFAVSSSFSKFFSLLEWRLYVYIWTWNFSGTETEKGHRKYPLSKNDGEWWMELSKGSQWWNKTSSLLPLSLSFSRFLGWPVILHMVVAGLDEAIRNIWTEWSVSDCYVAETLSCKACRFKKKKLLSQHHGCSLWRHQCSNLKKKKKKALAHLVTGERGRRSADRMKYHLVGLNDNFISHLTS